MKLADVMDEVAEALREFTGLKQVFAHPPKTITPPAGVVSYPDSIEYDATYGRGVDRIRGLPIILVVGKATDEYARDKVSAWSSGSGAESVKAELEGRTWNSCDDLTVSECSFDVVTIAGVDYLAAMFSADIIGEGS